MRATSPSYATFVTDLAIERTDDAEMQYIVDEMEIVAELGEDFKELPVELSGKLERNYLLHLYELEGGITNHFLSEVNLYLDEYRGALSIYRWNEKNPRQRERIVFSNKARYLKAEDVQYELVGEGQEILHCRGGGSQL